MAETKEKPSNAPKSKSDIEQAAIKRMLGKDREASEQMDGEIRLSQVTAPKVLPKSKRATIIASSTSITSSESANEEPDDQGYDQITGIGRLAPTIDRDAYLQCYRDLQIEKSQLLVKNSILQRRLAEYYKKRKLDHALKEVDNVGGIDLEEKYHQKLLGYEDLKGKEDMEMAEITGKVEEGERIHEERLRDATRKFQDLQHLEKTTGTGLIYSKKGKPIADKTVERLLHVQRRKSEQTSALRLRYVRARNAVAELDAVVRRLETLAPGLHVAHYEQLRIDNQNYMDKIEDREDELGRNRAKCTEHNQILAHIREKMHHTDFTIDNTECDLGDVEMDWLRAREDLNMVKGRRDSMRIQLNLERQKAGLLTKRDLLRDYEASADEVQELRKNKSELEDRINRSTVKLREARRKILSSHHGARNTAPQGNSDTNEEPAASCATSGLNASVVTGPGLSGVLSEKLK